MRRVRLSGSCTRDIWPAFQPSVPAVQTANHNCTILRSWRRLKMIQQQDE